MRTSIFFIALLAASVVCQQALVKGCVRWNNQTGTCNVCYRRQVATHGCGPLLPPTDNCLLHLEQQGQKTDCSLCRPRFSLQNNPRICVPGAIFNCVNQFQPTNGKNQCDACGNGQYPSPDGSTCSPLTAGAIPHCRWGEPRVPPIMCHRCSPGYVIAPDRNSCLPATATTTGCIILGNSGNCQACDVFAGYSMQKNGRCKFIKKE